MTTQYTVKELCDLINTPRTYTPQREKNSIQETQIFSGEIIVPLQEYDAWIEVEVVEQKIFTSNGNIENYKGWIPKECLTEIHAPFKEIKTSENNQLNPIEVVINEAKSFLNEPYLWGGRSHFSIEYELSSQFLTGCDCSGLVYNSYKKAGYYLPRNAKDQFKICTPITYNNIQPGDLIFEQPLNRDYITHVLLYIGADTCIESTLKTVSVRECCFKEYFQLFKRENTSSCLIGNSTFFIGRPFIKELTLKKP